MRSTQSDRLDLRLDAADKRELALAASLVGGVTPGRGGRDVHGVPVYDTVAAITSQQRVDASVISVPPAFVRDAARQRARQVIAQNTHVTLSAEESERFLDAFDAPFAPNPKLQRALDRSREIVR